METQAAPVDTMNLQFPFCSGYTTIAVLHGGGESRLTGLPF